MEVIKIAKNISNENIYSKKLNVAAYVRVSTETDFQTMSYESQLKYYKDKIHKNLNWNFVNIYADYGISGTKLENRNQFVEMMNDAISGKIDLILTKSVSRFARNTVDAIKYVRILKEKNIGIYFEEENINTLYMSGELLLTVLSSVSEQESKNISEHMKLAHKMRIKRGEPLVTVARIYGYNVDKKNNKLTVNPAEAEVVKLIFKLYLEGFSSYEISKLLEERKIKNTRNNTTWYSETIRFMLTNEKYIGDTIKGKSYKQSNTYKTKINYGEKPTYYFKDTHEAIISREDFEKVKVLMKHKGYNKAKERSNFQSPITKRDFTRKLRCACCGNYLSVIPQNRNGQYRIYWECGIYKAKHKKCNSKVHIRDDIIKFAFIKCYNKLLKDIFNNKFKINERIGITNINNKLSKEKKLKEKYTIQMSSLIDLFINKELNKHQFKEKEKIIQNRINENQKEINKLQSKKEEISLIIKEINNLKYILKSNTKKMINFEKEIFEDLINYVIIDKKTNSYLIRFIYNNKMTNNIVNDIEKMNVFNIKQKEFIKVIDFKINADSINRMNAIPKIKFVGKIRITFEIDSKI